MTLTQRDAETRHWQQTTLACVLTVLRGVTYKADETSPTDAPGFVPILRATNIGKRLNFDDPVYVPEGRVSPQQYLRPGDIVVAASSGSRSVVGKAAPFNGDWRGSFGAFCYALRPNESVDPEFLSWFLQTTEYRNRVSTLAAGVNINNLRREHIESTPFAMPPLDEQREIVAAIETQFARLDDAVAALERARTRLKRYRASVLKAACEGRLVPTEAILARQEGRSYEPARELFERNKAARVTSPGQKKRRGSVAPPVAALDCVPEGWTIATVEEIATAIVDCPHSTPSWTDVGRMCVRTSDFRPGFLDLSSARYVSDETYEKRTSRLTPREGDILYSREGAILGIACMVPAGVELCMGQRMMLIRCSDLVNGKYVMNFLNSPPALAIVQRLIGGSASPHVNVGDVKEFRIALPPREEQDRIVEETERRLSVLDRMEAEVTANLKRAESLRQAILRRAFSGNLISEGTITK
jgi:type I restriction enzyme S subunit